MLRGDRHYGLVDLRLTIFNLLSLIQNDIEPPAFISSLKYFNFCPQKLIRGDNYPVIFKGFINNTLFGLETPFFQIFITGESVYGDLMLEISRPKFELFYPLIDHSCGTDDQKWTDKRLISRSNLILVKRFPVSCAQG